MTWEAIGVIAALLTLCLGVVSVGVPSLIFLGRVLEKLDVMNKGLAAFQKMLDLHMAEETKTHDTFWKKQDAHAVKLENHEVRIGALEK